MEMKSQVSLVDTHRKKIYTTVFLESHDLLTSSRDASIQTHFNSKVGAVFLEPSLLQVSQMCPCFDQVSIRCGLWEHYISHNALNLRFTLQIMDVQV